MLYDASLPVWEELHPLSERLASLGVQLRAPLKLLITIVFVIVQGVLEGPSIGRP